MKEFDPSRDNPVNLQSSRIKQNKIIESIIKSRAKSKF